MPLSQDFAPKVLIVALFLLIEACYAPRVLGYHILSTITILLIAPQRAIQAVLTMIEEVWRDSYLLLRCIVVLLYLALLRSDPTFLIFIPTLLIFSEYSHIIRSNRNINLVKTNSAIITDSSAIASASASASASKGKRHASASRNRSSVAQVSSNISSSHKNGSSSTENNYNSYHSSGLRRYSSSSNNNNNSSSSSSSDKYSPSTGDGGGTAHPLKNDIDAPLSSSSAFLRRRSSQIYSSSSYGTAPEMGGTRSFEFTEQQQQSTSYSRETDRSSERRNSNNTNCGSYSSNTFESNHNSSENYDDEMNSDFNNNSNSNSNTNSNNNSDSSSNSSSNTLDINSVNSSYNYYSDIYNDYDYEYDYNAADDSEVDSEKKCAGKKRQKEDEEKRMIRDINLNLYNERMRTLSASKKVRKIMNYFSSHEKDDAYGEKRKFEGPGEDKDRRKNLQISIDDYRTNRDKFIDNKKAKVDDKASSSSRSATAESDEYNEILGRPPTAPKANSSSSSSSIFGGQKLSIFSTKSEITDKASTVEASGKGASESVFTLPSKFAIFSVPNTAKVSTAAADVAPDDDIRPRRSRSESVVETPNEPETPKLSLVPPGGSGGGGRGGVIGKTVGENKGIAERGEKSVKPLVIFGGGAAKPPVDAAKDKVDTDTKSIESKPLSSTTLNIFGAKPLALPKADTNTSIEKVDGASDKPKEIAKISTISSSIFGGGGTGAPKSFPAPKPPPADSSSNKVDHSGEVEKPKEGKIGGSIFGGGAGISSAFTKPLSSTAAPSLSLSFSSSASATDTPIISRTNSFTAAPAPSKQESIVADMKLSASSSGISFNLAKPKEDSDNQKKPPIGIGFGTNSIGGGGGGGGLFDKAKISSIASSISSTTSSSSSLFGVVNLKPNAVTKKSENDNSVQNKTMFNIGSSSSGAALTSFNLTSEESTPITRQSSISSAPTKLSLPPIIGGVGNNGLFFGGGGGSGISRKPTEPKVSINSSKNAAPSADLSLFSNLNSSIFGSSKDKKGKGGSLFGKE